MKKLLHMLLCLTLLSAHISVFANEPAVEQLSTLYEYGIFQGDETGELNLDKNITRAEFCKVILSSLGYSKDVLREFEEIDNFVDVKDTHWAYLYIHNAKKLSLINGYEDGCFLPEANISMSEVIKIVVNSLGYEPKAKELGGYPAGYLLIANDLGLTENIDLYPNEPALRGDVANVIYAALDVPLMQMVEFGEKTEYKVMNGTADAALITWNLRFKNELHANTSTNLPSESMPVIPRFNGPEYTGRILKITELNKNVNGYTFKNSLNDEDNFTYVINKDTYVYISTNTVGLNEIKTDMYAQCWYYTDDLGDIEVLKIELMREKPAGI